MDSLHLSISPKDLRNTSDLTTSCLKIVLTTLDGQHGGNPSRHRAACPLYYWKYIAVPKILGSNYQI